MAQHLVGSPSRSVDDLLPQFLASLARRGMAVIGGPGLNPQLATVVQEEAFPAPVIVDYDGDLLATFPGPLTWVLTGETLLAWRGPSLDRLSSGEPTYLVHPRSLQAAGRPGTRLVEVCDASLSLNYRSRSAVMTLLNDPASLPSYDVGSGALPAVCARPVPG